jgi:FADH2 O2-dependent halogenase
LSGSFDIAIVGAGFGGSLLAAIARRLGRSVVLVEKAKHPRFAIGESTTRLSNLLLEGLAVKYELTGLQPLSRWGTWQEKYPRVPVGLNRGFSFFHHRSGRTSDADLENASPLLIETSPNDRAADTHWYRAAVDQLFLNEAISAGAEYLDQTNLSKMSVGPGGVRLTGKRLGAAMELDAKFVFDASGPRGFVHHAAGLFNRGFEGLPNTQGLYSHFQDVERLDQIPEFGVGAATEPPATAGGTDFNSGIDGSGRLKAGLKARGYSVDDTAVHHLFDGGWMWVLRFNNGLTSAGIAVTDETAGQLRLANGEKAWLRLLESYPAIHAQFGGARRERPLIYNRRLSYLASAITGDGWAMLPSSAGFVDPMLSTGFPLTLLGIERLATLLETDWGTDRFATGLQEYAARTERELQAAARLVTALYRNLNDFSRFSALALLYFAATSFGEVARRLGKPALADLFLLENDPRFGPEMARILSAEPVDTVELRRQILAAIEPFDLMGLTRPDQGNFYPFDTSKLQASTAKMGVDQNEVSALLGSLTEP